MAFSVVLLGSFQLRCGEQPIPLALAPARALLAYLAVEVDQPHRRELLATLLWPNHPQAAAFTNLRQTLARLRKALPDPSNLDAILAITPQTIQLNAGIEVDVVRFSALLAASDAHPHADRAACPECRDRLAQAVALYEGELLYGNSGDGGQPFEEWLDLRRETLRQQALEALETLTRAHESSGDYDQMRAYAARQLTLEPWREQAHRDVMRALALAGKRPAALAQYEACRRVLKRELGIEPDAETEALYAHIQAGSLGKPQVSARAPARNLPAPLTSFIGRAAEIATLQQALANTRLLTLTGAGGSGKTRLALALAHTVADAYRDGVWLVELAPLTDPALLEHAVAAELRLHEEAGQPLREQLMQKLRASQLVLLLDNCEHLLPACRELVQALLQACPSVIVLATSRTLLQVDGEQVWLVPPLATPDGALTTPDQLLAYDSVRLFVERARTANSTFALSERNAPTVAQICHRLDGTPLALELAAARLRHMAVETIAARLDDRFGLLTSGSPTALPRHQTLRATIDWSYALLSRPARVLFRRLAVFAGGWTLDAAERVVGPSESAAEDRATTVDLLASLIDQSLVVVEARSDALPYRMLETISDYAREKLLASGEAETLRDSHLAYYLGLAEQAEAYLYSAAQSAWLDRLAADHDNLRVAFDRALAQADAPAALRLVVALRSFWHTRSFYDEGRRRTLAALEMPAAQAPTPLRARALNAAGALLWASRDAAAARPLLDEALAIGRACRDAWNIGWALLHKGMIAYQQGDHMLARRLLKGGIANSQAAGLEGRRGVGWGHIFLGDVALQAGDPSQAEEHFEEGVAQLRELGDHAMLAYPLRRLGHLATERGDVQTAQELCAESLRHNLAIDDRLAVGACFAVLAAVSEEEASRAGAPRRAGHMRRAAQRCGAAAAWAEAVGAPLWPADAAVLDEVRTRLAQQLDATTLAEAEAEGRRMAVEQLLAPVAEEPPPIDQEPTAAPTSNLPAPLTPLVGREHEVATIVAQCERPDVRLITLLGTGGVGKTRLALEVARWATPRFPDGVLWVDLAEITEPSQVVAAMARALGLKEAGEQPLQQQLKRALRSQRALVVLDNFEQVIAAASAVADLLTVCPRLTCLVTSRTALLIDGEREVHLHPLDVPDPAQHTPFHELTRYAAVALFIQRAEAVLPTFALTDGIAGAVAEICRRLEGLPLAIELAAARIKLLPPPLLLQRLANRLDFLTGVKRDTPNRHQTLRNTIDWSYNLLQPHEQQLFARLAVFAGGATLAGAEGVCRASDTLDGLQSLVDNSLVRQTVGEDGEPRFTTLEMLREYGIERLAQRGEAELVRSRHVAYYLHLAEQAAPELAGGPEQVVWFRRVGAELDNMRVALRRAVDGADAQTALRLGVALREFWMTRALLSEGRSWLEAALALDDHAAPVGDGLRSNALTTAGWLAANARDYAAANAFFDRGLALARRTEEPAQIIAVLGDLAQALRMQGDTRRAITLYQERLALCREEGDERGASWSLCNLGIIAHSERDDAGAGRLLEEGFALSQTTGDRICLAWCMTFLARVFKDRGQYIQSAAAFAQTLALFGEVGHTDGVAFTLEGWAGLAATTGDIRSAARVFGAAEALRETIGRPQPPYDRDLETSIDTNSADWQAAWAEGRVLQTDQAIALVLGASPDVVP
jgi:predicted ATPase/DNA-binding SARP family transcriptional activator